MSRQKNRGLVHEKKCPRCSGTTDATKAARLKYQYECSKCKTDRKRPHRRAEYARYRARERKKNIENIRGDDAVRMALGMIRDFKFGGPR